MSAPGSGPGRRGSLNALATAVSLATVTGLAAAVGVVIGRQFGRTAETDGFFAAYAVFVVIALIATASRVVVLPRLAEAARRDELAPEAAAYAAALAVVAVPLVVVAEVAPGTVADVLTGSGGDAARTAAADALRWVIPAAAAQLFAGLAASTLAALDDYTTSALGFAAGSAAGFALILWRAPADGIVAVAWGMCLNGAVALAVPAAALAWRRGSAAGLAARGAGVPQRLWEFARGSAVPLAAQALYLVCVPFASREGEGAVTSFGYAYLVAAALVAVTASSIALVSSVPLAREGLGAGRVTRHVVAASWLSLAVVAGAAGVFALAGGTLVQGALGSEYGASAGAGLGRLVVAFAPFIVVSSAFSLVFPLVFIDRRERRLPALATGALAVHVPLAWAGQEVAGLDGLVAALTVTTALILAFILHALGALRATLSGLAVAAFVVGAAAAAAFGAARLALDGIPAAGLGAVLYGAALAVAARRPLAASWAYLHALGDVR